jgi:hypothetical protein
MYRLTQPNAEQKNVLKIETLENRQPKYYITNLELAATAPEFR